MSRGERIAWPEGKDFAFTVFDDTDGATVENVAPIYDFLTAIGLRTTKSVWPIAAKGLPAIGGATCEDPDYVAWTLDLQARGFEIGYHGASYITSPRDAALRAIERFRALYGHYPLSMANHADCEDSMYWGSDRVSGANRVVYNLLTRFTRRGVFRGHREGDPLFWGDVCRDRVRYVRNFTYHDIDTLAACPVMPYHDPLRPYVNRWFASSEGANVTAFNRCVSEANQDHLRAQGGACIMYTHFASGFWSGGEVDSRFRVLMERLSGMNGWFVPVSTLLDYLSELQGDSILTDAQRCALERRWLLSKIRVGHT